MENKYQPNLFELSRQKLWEEQKTFYADDNSKAPKFYMLEMFAYPSGKLHMGHVRNYSIGDVVARYKKKQGFNVLHPFGWDAFGLPAENAAIERGVHPAGWTYNNIREMRSQLKALGLAYDWDAEIATCHPEYYRWEQFIFLRALEKGLVYRKKALVNWSDKMQTVLANEQVIDGCDYRYGLPVVQKELTQWFFKTTAYAEDLLAGIKEDLEGNWPDRVLLEQRARIGKSHGARVDFKLEEKVDGDDLLPIFTTRPDTLWGVTFMSLAAEHPLALKLAAATEKEKDVNAFVQKVLAEDKRKRGSEDYKKEGVFTGKYCINPVNGDRVPIYIANFVLMDYGTGAVMAVPAHDQRDFEFSKEYNIPIRVVIQPDSQDLDPATMTEAYVDDGTQIDSAHFSGMNNRAALEKITDFLADKGFGGKTTNYKLRDWCVSRQRYWGAPIPIIYCDNCDVVPVPYDQLPVVLPEDVVFQPEGGSPLARCDSFTSVTCPKCGGPARRETDTFDTFVESSWYFLRYTCPRYAEAPVDPEKIRKWLPVDQYIGGIEHAVGHLVYGRFFHKLMQDLDLFPKDVAREPFTRLLTQGMVCKDTMFTRDENGLPEWHDSTEVKDGTSLLNGKQIETGRIEKMSKSKRNGIDPGKIISKYGVDSARLFVLFASPPENDLIWKDDGVDGVHRFLSRIWNLVYQRLDALKNAAPYIGDGTNLNEEAVVLRRITHKTIMAVTEDVEKRFHFNTAIARCMELTNAISKFRAKANDPLSSSIQRDAVFALVNMLSPFAPHICEELWTEIGEEGQVSESPWPTYDDRIAADDVITIAVQVMGKLRARIETPAGCSKEDMEKLALEHDNIKRHIEGKTVRKIIVIPGKLVNIVAN